MDNIEIINELVEKDLSDYLSRHCVTKQEDIDYLRKVFTAGYTSGLTPEKIK